MQANLNSQLHVISSIISLFASIFYVLFVKGLWRHTEVTADAPLRTNTINKSFIFIQSSLYVCSLYIYNYVISSCNICHLQFKNFFASMVFTLKNLHFDRFRYLNTSNCIFCYYCNIHIYIQTYIHIFIYTCIHEYLHTYTYINIYMHT